MSLTGTTFLGLVLAATVTAFAVVVWRWGAVAGPDPRSVARRVARRAGLNLMVLLCAAVALNHVYLFYADWTDLLGATGLGAASRTLAAGGAPSGALGGLGQPVGNNQYRLPLLPRGIGPGHRVLYYDVTGRASGITGEVMVILPRTYRRSIELATRYPVIEAFHGYPGNVEQMVHPFTLQQDEDAAAARGRFADPLIVAPELEFPLDADTECANGPAGYP